MVILAAAVELYLPGVASLKEKRSVLKSLIARLHKQFNIAVAEVDCQDVWQSATLGVAIVSNSAPHAEQVLERMLGWVERNRPDVEIVGHTLEILHINTR